jgi:hypothetical protein
MAERTNNSSPPSVDSFESICCSRYYDDLGISYEVPEDASDNIGNDSFVYSMYTISKNLEIKSFYYNTFIVTR